MWHARTTRLSLRVWSADVMSKVIRFPEPCGKSDKWNQTVECICLHLCGFCWRKWPIKDAYVAAWYEECGSIRVTIRENKHSKSTLLWPGTTLALLPDLFPINLSTPWQSESDGSAWNSYCLSISPAAAGPVKPSISNAETIQWLLDSTGAS